MGKISESSNLSSVCALCRGVNRLENSHILSEFLHRGMYDAKHRFGGLDIEAKTVRIHQKGFREYLLCRQCEQQFGQWERYASDVFFGDAGLNADPGVKEVNFSGLDYSRMKLFFLSLIWRLGVTKLRFLKGAEIGAHAEKLRSMLLAGEPGPYDRYPCFVTSLVFQGKPVPDVIVPPVRKRLEGHWIWHVTVGGFVLSYYVSSHSPPSLMHSTFLSEDGRLKVIVRDITEIDFLYRIAGEIAASGIPERLRKQLGACPKRD